MKTVGAMLREARTSQGITLEDVEKATKIRKKFLEAIEEDAYGRIPTHMHAKGFVKNYSDFLRLDTNTFLAFFRRQIRDIPKSSLLPKKADETLRESWFRLTPARFIAVLVGFLTLIFLTYFALQYRRLYLPPSLTLDRPKQDAISGERKIDVLGRTNADATVAVNGTSAVVRSDGSFFEQVTLEPGVNTITVTAMSRYGKSTTIVRKVGLKQ